MYTLTNLYECATHDQELSFRKHMNTHTRTCFQGTFAVASCLVGGETEANTLS